MLNLAANPELRGPLPNLRALDRLLWVSVQGTALLACTDAIQQVPRPGRRVCARVRGGCCVKGIWFVLGGGVLLLPRA